MVEPTLAHLERDVEAARAKLARDLSTLRSPATSAEFTESLKHEVIEAKDALVDKAKKQVQSSVQSFLEDVKGRAIANPAAALAIGSGIAWRLLRNPPIATALVGVGLLSLFRTSPARLNGGTGTDYLVQAKGNFLQQAKETAEVVAGRAAVVGETVSEVGEAISEKVTETATAIGETARELTADAASTVREMAKNTQERASTMWTETVEKAEARDKALLGAAGLAVVAALGIAYQRRLAEHTE